MPLGDRRIGRTDAQEKPARRELVQARGLKRQSRRRATENVIDRRADFEPGGNRGDRRQHHRGILVVSLAAPGAIEAMGLGELSELRDRVHRQLRAGIKLDIDFHAMR